MTLRSLVGWFCRHETLRDFASGKSTADDPRLCAMSQQDRDAGFAISPDGERCQSRETNAWHGGRATVGIIKGRYYYEVTVTDEGLCRVGWSTRTAKFDLGTDACGFGFGGTGKKSFNKRFDDYGEAFGLGDTIGCYLDADAGHVWFSKNGRQFERAFELPKYLKGVALFPACVLKNAEMLFNFGAKPWRFPPEGFAAICSAPKEHTSCVASLRQPGQKRKPMAIILEPNLELAQQAHDELLKFTRFLPEPKLQCELIIGGVPSQPQINAIARGIDVITATPGRLVDLIQGKQLDVSDVRFFILDEADRLLDGGNFRTIENIYDALDKTHLQVCMFSATLHSGSVTDISKKICKFPTWVDLKGRDSVPDTVHHAQLVIDPSKTPPVWKHSALDVQTDGVHAGEAQARVRNTKEWCSEQVKLLKARYLVELINEYKMEQAIIFIRTRLDAEHLETYLNALSKHESTSKLEHRYSCLQLHAGKGTGARLDNLERFRNGEVRFLIATDVAARGIDIAELPFIVNFTLPDKTEDYVHRVGRVGRAGATGIAISLVASCEEKVWFHSCKNRGDGCRNTKLANKGGCCVWYNEPQLMSQIEDRLGGIPVQEIDSQTLQCPGLHGANTAELSKEAEAKRLLSHNEEIRSMVEDLRVLEAKLQVGAMALAEQYTKKRG